jgi:ribosomal protein S6E (S10)
MIIQVFTQATGGWKFHFGVTENQAYQIINARIGDVVLLSEPGEQIRRFDNKTFTNSKITGGGGTNEDLVAADVIAKVQDLIDENAWSPEE